MFFQPSTEDDEARYQAEMASQQKEKQQQKLCTDSSSSRKFDAGDPSYAITPTQSPISIPTLAEIDPFTKVIDHVCIGKTFFSLPISSTLQDFGFFLHGFCRAHLYERIHATMEWHCWLWLGKKEKATKIMAWFWLFCTLCCSYISAHGQRSLNMCQK